MTIKAKLFSMLCLAAFGATTIAGYAEAEESHDSDNQKINEQSTSISTSDVKKISEAFGYLIGNNLKNPGFTFDMESIIKGIRDAAAGKEAPMSESEYEEMIAMIQENAFNELATTNLQEAESFLDNNADTEGVIVVEDGKLQYQVMEKGEGQEVSSGSSPKIHYTGTFLDGSTFGSSLDNGEPIVLTLEQTIPGFSKGIVGMKEGEKRKLFIHPDMAYGTSGQLPPNSLLIFEVEVIQADSTQDSAE
ncbi:MAG: FKBP-type peptidyl-prolyl cis-trans isomerase [Chlamydiota bacterium]